MIGYGVYFIRLISPFYLLANFNQIYAGASAGRGMPRCPCSSCWAPSWCSGRSTSTSPTLVWHPSAGGLGYPVGWVMCSVVLFFYYRSGKWMKRSFVVQ